MFTKEKWQFFCRKGIPILLALIVFLSLSFCMGVAAEAEAIFFRDSEDPFADDGSKEFFQERITGSKIEITDTYITTLNFPKYSNGDPNVTNSCANVAGAEVLSYYNVQYPLIDGLVSGIAYGGGTYYFWPMGFYPQMQSTINTLYNLMATNSNRNGTTKAQFDRGMTSYLESKGHSYNYTNIAKNQKLDIDAAYELLAAGIPITLFMKEYNYLDIDRNSNDITLVGYHSFGNHVLNAYGIRRVDVYDSNDQIERTELFLVISLGYQGESSFDFMHITSDISFVHALGITVA